MAVRLLAPPGICVCELALPLERLIAEVCRIPQPRDHCEEEDSRFGCVLCQLPPAVEPKQVPAPPPGLSLELPVLFSAAGRSAPTLSPDTIESSHLRPAALALRLSHCPLLI